MKSLLVIAAGILVMSAQSAQAEVAKVDTLVIGAIQSNEKIGKVVDALRDHELCDMNINILRVKTKKSKSSGEQNRIYSISYLCHNGGTTEDQQIIRFKGNVYSGDQGVFVDVTAVENDN